jgi:hypothetical protein
LLINSALFIVDFLKVLSATKIDGFFSEQNIFQQILKFVICAETLIWQGF